MAGPEHGKNGLIYVSGTTEWAYANAWTLNIDTESAEYASFGDTWKSRKTGLHDWGGSITVWHDQDGQLPQTAAIADVVVAILIYPSRTDTSTYYSGNAIFSTGDSADMTSIISQSVSFVGSSTLGITGFAV